MINPFKRLTLNQIVTRELEEARLSRLAAQNAHEYAASAVSYRDHQICRLEKLLELEAVAA